MDQGVFRPRKKNMSSFVILACFLLTLVTSSHSTLDDVTQSGLGENKGGKLVLTAACSDYPSCELDLELLRKAVDTHNMAEACGHATASYQCQRSATNLCEKEGVVNAVALNTMKRAYIYTEIYVQEMCHHGSLPDTPTIKGGSHCSEFRSCFGQVKRYKQAVGKELYHQACGIATRILECSKSAMLDCRERGSLSQEAMSLMKDTTVQAGYRVDTVCDFTTTPTPPSPTPPSTFQCFDFATCPHPDLDVLQVARRTGQFDGACRSVSPHAKCLEEAVRDCEDKRLVSGIALKSMKESLAKAHQNVKMYCPFYELDVLMGHVMLSAPDSETGSVPTFDLRTTHPPLTCLDIGSCPRPTVPAGRPSKTVYQQACKSMKVHAFCIEYATDDCKVRNLVSGSAFESMVQDVKNAKQLTKRYCDKADEETRVSTLGQGTTPAPLTCLQIESCPRSGHVPAGRTQATATDYQDACKKMKVHTSCIDHATNDCKVRNLITGSALGSMTQKVKDAKQWTERYCHMARELSQDDSHNSGISLRPSSHTTTTLTIITSLLLLSPLITASIVSKLFLLAHCQT